MISVGIFTKNKQIVDPNKPVMALTLGGVLNKQLADIKDNIPKGYTLVMNDTHDLSTIKSYVERLRRQYAGFGSGKSIMLVNDWMRNFGKDKRVLAMVVQNVEGESKLSITSNSNGVGLGTTYDMPLDDYESVFVFLLKGDKMHVYCVYDKDKEDLNKIVDSFNV